MSGFTYSWDHLHLRSLDPVATARFYVEALQGVETGRVEVKGALRVTVRLGGVLLFIEQVPADTAAPPAPPFLGIEHIGLAVDDLDAAAADLQAQGVTFVVAPRVSRPGLRVAFVEGPERVRIELIERGPS